MEATREFDDEARQMRFTADAVLDRILQDPKVREVLKVGARDEQRRRREAAAQVAAGAGAEA